MGFYAGWLGGFTLSEGNTHTTVTRNIAAGTWHHGFHFEPSACGEGSPSTIFRGNVAHSISGYGAIAKNVVNPCTEVKDFIAYKCTQSSVMHGGPSMINRGINLVSIDNHYGIAVHPGAGTSELVDSFSYAEYVANEDCPENSPCDHCMTRGGVLMPLGAKGPAGQAHLDRQPK